MADARFSFQDRGRCHQPQWVAPEALQKKGKEINVKVGSLFIFSLVCNSFDGESFGFQAADMWSFAVLLWELATRQVPFADLSPMEAGLKVPLQFSLK